MSALRLSKSQLDKFVACPRCFWLHHRMKVDQPDMISSKVWKGIERVTQAHYAEHRLAKTTPPNLIGQVPEGAIPYQEGRIDLKSLRYWGKGLSFTVDGVLMTTALDDMLERSGGTDGVKLFNVIDFKSKSKATDAEATADLYQNQADVFDLACNANDYPTDGKVYFDYWYPVAVREAEAPQAGAEVPHGLTTQLWGSQVIALTADHERIKALIRAAAACLDGPLPEPNVKQTVGKRGGVKTEGCPVCAYVLELQGALKPA